MLQGTPPLLCRLAMVFDHSINPDASNGTFNHVCGNHITVNHYGPTIHLSLFGSAQSSHYPLRNSRKDLPLSASFSEVQCKGDPHITTYCSSETISVIQTDLGLIVQIMDLLAHCRVSSNTYLAIELKSLQKTLTLIVLAIQEYDARPLESLANRATPEVERCCSVLHELLGKIGGTWQPNFTGIYDMWKTVWWCRWGEDELIPLIRKLCVSRASLDGLLMALNLYVLLFFVDYY